MYLPRVDWSSERLLDYFGHYLRARLEANSEMAVLGVSFVSAQSGHQTFERACEGRLAGGAAGDSPHDRSGSDRMGISTGAETAFERSGSRLRRLSCYFALPTEL